MKSRFRDWDGIFERHFCTLVPEWETGAELPNPLLSVHWSVLFIYTYAFFIRLNKKAYSTEKVYIE